MIAPPDSHSPHRGRESLCFCSKVTIDIEGWDKARAQEYLQALQKVAAQDEFCYRLQWSVGETVL